MIFVQWKLLWYFQLDLFMAKNTVWSSCDAGQWLLVSHIILRVK